MTTPKLLTLTAAAAILCGTLLAGIAEADESEANALPVATEPDRTIYVNGPAPRVSDDVPVDQSRSTARTEVRVTEGTVFATIPAPGETVRIVYTDAVTDITTQPDVDASARASGLTAAACTESVTAYKAYKDGNKARENGMFQISTGCKSGKAGKVYLYQVVLASTNSALVANTGYATSFSTSYTCASTRTKNWSGKAGFSGITSGPTASLACDMP